MLSSELPPAKFQQHCLECHVGVVCEPEFHKAVGVGLAECLIDPNLTEEACYKGLTTLIVKNHEICKIISFPEKKYLTN